MKKPLFNIFLASVVAPASLALTASNVHAVALTWDTTIAADGTITAGNGTWQNGAGNWNNGATSVAINWNNANPDTATFAGADGTHAITVGGGITSGAITFNNSGYTLSAASAQVITGSGAITVASGKSATIGTNVTLNRTAAYSVTGGGTLNITGTGATLAATSGITTVSGSKVVVGTGGTFSGQTSIVIGNNTSAAELEVNGGAVNITTTSASNLVLANNAGAGSAIITLNSGSITNSLVGGTVRFGSTAANTSSSTFNLNGGILTVGRVFEGNAGHSSTFNFNGGTLKVLATSTNLATYMTGIDTANVRNGGAVIDTSGADATVGQNLVHSVVGGDAATDGGLTKIGAGSLILGGTNTYTGTTTISAGTISAGNIVVSGGSSHLGNAASAVTLGSAGSQGILAYTGTTATYTRGFTIGGAGGGRFNVSTSGQTVTMNTSGVTGTGLFTVGGAGNTIINSAITHTGGVTKGPFDTATAALTLGSGSNTYDGVTTVQHGAIVVTSNNALGNTSSGTVVSSGASLALSGGIDYAATETVTGSGAGAGAITGVLTDIQRGFIQSASGSNTFRGNIVIDAGGITRIGTQNGASLTLTGTITQATGTVLFRSGNNAGDYVTLTNSGNSFGGDSTVFNAATAGNHAGLRLGVNDALPTSLTVSGFTSAGAGTAFNLNGYNQTLNGLITGAGGLNIINSDTLTASTLTLNPSVDKSTTNTLIRGGGGLGTINVIKSGGFSQTLSGTHDYTGTTAVNAGTLVVNGNISTSVVTVAAGATLGGSGTLGGNTTISGNHTPGNSPGIQTFGANLSYNTGATVGWELTADALVTRGTQFDGIDVGGNLDFTGTTTINLAFNGVGSAVDWTDTFWDTSHTGTSGWLVYDVTGTTTNFGNLSINTIDWIDGSGGLFNTLLTGSTFSLYQDGNDIYLNYNAIPEPRAALLGGLGLLALLRRRR